MILSTLLATASTSSPTPVLADLVAGSDTAAYGRIDSVRVERVRGEHWTVVRVTAPSGPSTVMRFPGGCIGEVCMTVPDGPRVERGEWVVVFLVNGQPTRLNDGVFHVSGAGGLAEPVAMVLEHGKPVVQAPLRTVLEAAAPILTR